MNRVHERLHVKDPAPARLHQILRIERVADLGRIESLSLVGYRDLQLRAAKGERGVHLLGDVELVSMLDGVGDGFPDGHADPMRSIFIDARVFAEMFRDHLYELDVLESTADGDVDPLAVTFHSLNRGAF